MRGSIRGLVRGLVGVAGLAGLMTLGACATTGAGSGEASADRDVLTHAQLAGLEHLSAYDVVRRLKPAWLRTGRGQDSFVSGMQSRRGVRVYVNGALLGTVVELRQIPSRDVQEIRHMDPREATMEFGTDHTEGALLVTTR